MNTRERYARNTAIITAYNDGVPATDIAATHGITTATVYHVVREAREEGAPIPNRTRGARKIHGDRNVVIVDRYQSGETLEAIGNDYGLSRERIRQIIRKHGVATYNRNRSVVAYRAWVDTHGDEINATFSATRSINATCAAHPEVPTAWVRRFLRPRAGESIHGRTAVAKVWTDEGIFTALRAAAVDGIVTTTGYARWRRSGATIDGRIPPTTSLITWRFGSWKQAAEAAGLSIGRTSRTNYERQWTRDDALTAVTKFVHDADTRGIRPTYARYDAWVSENPGHPSGAYLRHLTGASWSEILMEAIAAKAA